MSKRSIVLVNYPLSARYCDKLTEITGENSRIISLSDLRMRGMVGMLFRLLQLRGSRVFVPSEDPESGPVANIMLIIATFIPFSDRYQVCPQFRVSRLSRMRGLMIGCMVAYMSLKCWIALYAALIDMSFLRTISSQRAAQLKSAQVKKVMYLNANLWFGVKSGGSVGHVAGVVNALVAKDICVTHYSCSQNPSIKEGVNDKRLRVPQVFGMPWDRNYVHYNSVVAAQLQKDTEGYDFIYQRLSLGNYSGVKEALRRKVPLVIEYNGSEVWVAKNWGRPLKNEAVFLRAEELCLSVASLIVCISEPLREELVARGVSAKKITVYPNCVDTNKFSPSRYSRTDVTSQREQLGVPDDSFVFGFIGTFGHWHGAEILASAFSDFVKKNLSLARKHKVHLLLIGDGVLKEEVKKQLSKIPPEFYTFTGIIPQELAPLYLSCCDIFCSPHVPNEDGSKFFGSPTKLFEYMAMAKPIIASDLDQIGVVLKNGSPVDEQKNAILVKPGSVDDLAAAIKDVLTRDDLSILARNSFDLAVKKYTWERHVEHILSELSHVA